MKTFISIASLFLAVSLFANATPSSSFIKVVTNNPIELIQVSKTTIQVKATLTTTAAEYYELQRSYDNKTFSTVSILMPFTNEEGNKPILLKDKINENSTMVYYRIVKIAEEKISFTAQNNIALN